MCCACTELAGSMDHRKLYTLYGVSHIHNEWMKLPLVASLTKSPFYRYAWQLPAVSLLASSQLSPPSSSSASLQHAKGRTDWHQSLFHAVQWSRPMSACLRQACATLQPSAESLKMNCLGLAQQHETSEVGPSLLPQHPVGRAQTTCRHHTQCLLIYSVQTVKKSLSMTETMVPELSGSCQRRQAFNTQADCCYMEGHPCSTTRRKSVSNLQHHGRAVTVCREARSR